MRKIITLSLNNIFKSYYILSLLIFIGNTTVFAQKHWVYFSDKGLTEQQHKSLSKPEITDLPVSVDYISQIKQAGYNVTGSSKWLNAIVVDSVESIEHLYLSCKSIHRTESVRISKKIHDDKKKYVVPENSKSSSFYGETRYQNDLINIKPLHDKGFTGEGIKIAVLDAGFRNLYRCKAFQKINEDSLIVAKWRAYDNGTNIDTGSYHGSYVLSTMASYIPNRMVGVAYDASYILIIVEFTSPYSEDHWVFAAEYAAEKGARIIQSSLGYFYSPSYPSSSCYTYDLMDGQATAVTRAADIAASKGILVVNAAGNSGNSFSLGMDIHIVAPADGDSVVAVGSVDKYRIHHPISSYGPTYDGRIKPDLMAMGKMAALMGDDENTIIRDNGTSFAAPVISGLAACLMQAHPNRSNMEVFDAMKKSASNYQMPDTVIGYGIPNAKIADSILTVFDGVNEVGSMKSKFLVYPTLASDFVNIENIENINFELRIISLSGKVVQEYHEENKKINKKINVMSLKAGIYFFTFNCSGIKTTLKIIKI